MKKTYNRILYSLAFAACLFTAGCSTRQGSRSKQRSLHSFYTRVMHSQAYQALKNKQSFTKKQVREHATMLAGDLKELKQLISLYNLSKKRSRLYSYRMSDMKKLIKEAYTSPEQYIQS